MTDAQLRTLAAPCGNLTAACKADFIRNTLTRAYRRPPAADEIAEAGEIFDLAVPSGDAVLPFRAVVQADLTSPFFLYRTEIGAQRRPGDLPADQPRGGVVAVVQPAGTGAASELARGRRPGRADDAGQLAHERRGAAGDARGGRAAARLPVPVADADQGQRRLYKFPDLFPGFDGVRTAMMDEANAFFTANGAHDGTIATC